MGAYLIPGGVPGPCQAVVFGGTKFPNLKALLLFIGVGGGSGLGVLGEIISPVFSLSIGGEVR